MNAMPFFVALGSLRTPSTPAARRTSAIRLVRSALMNWRTRTMRIMNRMSRTWVEGVRLCCQTHKRAASITGSTGLSAAFRRWPSRCRAAVASSGIACTAAKSTNVRCVGGRAAAVASTPFRLSTELAGSAFPSLSSSSTSSIGFHITMIAIVPSRLGLFIIRISTVRCKAIRPLFTMAPVARCCFEFRLACSTKQSFAGAAN